MNWFDNVKQKVSFTLFSTGLELFTSLIYTIHHVKCQLLELGFGGHVSDVGLELGLDHT